MTAIPTRRLRAGLYEAPDGHLIEAVDDNPQRLGWWLLTPAGEWMQTYATKRDAIEGLAQVWAEELAR